MRRFHTTTEEAIMKARAREELKKHTDKVFNTVQDGCHCLRGLGAMRKKTPWGNHSPGKCSLCEIERMVKRKEKRAFRRSEKPIIREALAE